MLNWLWTQLRRLWDAILRTGAEVDDNTTKVVSTYETIKADTLNLLKDIDDLRHFDFNPQWNTRVISVPKAADAINEIIFTIMHGFRIKFGTLHVAVDVLIAALKGKISGHLPDPGPSGTLTRVVDYIGDLDVAWKAFGAAYHDAVDLVDTVDDIKRKIETLDVLFLPQGNPKSLVDKHYRQRQRRR